MPPIRGLLFDKDGTLFDFQATWGGWAADLVLDLAGGDAALADDLAARLLLDRPGRRFHPESFVIAGTTDEAAAALLPGLPGWSHSALMLRLVQTAMQIAPVEAAPLGDLMGKLSGEGFRIGVATNDAEAAAMAQLDGLGVARHFEFVVGADSGHGAKPAPGQCLAFCEATGLAPGEVAMIGDSTHDLHAGRAAGMVPVAVLTGPATAEDLAPHADVVLHDIGELPAWLAGR